jgi:hypothetical protein
MERSEPNFEKVEKRKDIVPQQSHFEKGFPCIVFDEEEIEGYLKEGFILAARQTPRID